MTLTRVDTLKRSNRIGIQIESEVYFLIRLNFHAWEVSNNIIDTGNLGHFCAYTKQHIRVAPKIFCVTFKEFKKETHFSFEGSEILPWDIFVDCVELIKIY